MTPPDLEKQVQNVQRFQVNGQTYAKIPHLPWSPHRLNSDNPRVSLSLSLSFALFLFLDFVQVRGCLWGSLLSIALPTPLWNKCQVSSSSLLSSSFEKESQCVEEWMCTRDTPSKLFSIIPCCLYAILHVIIQPYLAKLVAIVIVSLWRRPPPLLLPE